MRQTTKKLTDKEVLFVEVPKDAIQCRYFPTLNRVLYTNNNGKSEAICLPDYRWQYICEASIATEEEAARVVKKKMFGYPDYMSEQGTLVTSVLHQNNFFNAKESLSSLIKSVGIELVNPMGDEPKENSEKYYGTDAYLYELDLAFWQISQAKVWEKVLILISK